MSLALLASQLAARVVEATEAKREAESRRGVLERMTQEHEALVIRLTAELVAHSNVSCLAPRLSEFGQPMPSSRCWPFWKTWGDSKAGMLKQAPGRRRWWRALVATQVQGFSGSCRRSSSTPPTPSAYSLGLTFPGPGSTSTSRNLLRSTALAGDFTRGFNGSRLRARRQWPRFPRLVEVCARD